MALKEGNVNAMIREGLFKKNGQITKSLLKQMLRALDYLAYHNAVHRDVKPANILYTSLPDDRYRFQLADFGLCNMLTEARSFVGSPLFMAPDISLNQGIQQTSKVDVWSLFVTLAVATDASGYHQKAQQKLLLTPDSRIHAAREAAKELHKLEEMARPNPEERASAAQMLVKLWDGRGLTTPREMVPDLPQAHHPNEAAAQADTIAMQLDEILNNPTAPASPASAVLPTWGKAPAR